MVPIGLMIAARLWRDAPVGRWRLMLVLASIGVALIAATCALISSTSVLWLPAGWGGVIGLAIANGIRWAIDFIGDPAIILWTERGVSVLIGAAGAAIWVFGLLMDGGVRDWRRPRMKAIGVERREPEQEILAPEPARKPTPRAIAIPDARPGPVIADRSIAPSIAKPRSKQTSLDFGDNSQLPPLDLLKPAPPAPGGPIDKAALERNARLLETVLDDFHVKGQIVEVRPGPVVTMYELEPASGIKASRVIQLADDIARNMSALSARVATIPGRTVIGIELPNAHRETVVLARADRHRTPSRTRAARCR